MRNPLPKEIIFEKFKQLPSTKFHKSQGSEYDHVLMVLPDRDAPVLTRELLYTGVTRAKNRLSWWVPNASVLFNAVGQRVTRSGGLSDGLFHRSK